MVNYHKILMLANKHKYIGLILILIISSIVSVSAVQSFIAEDTGLPNLFIVGILQVLLLLQYVFIRLLYRDELLSLKKDYIHLFVIHEKANRYVFLNKLGQILLIYFMQYILFLLFMLIFQVSFEAFVLISIATFTGFVLVLLIYLIDLDNVNGMIKGIIESIAQTSLLALAIALFYFPSIRLLVICCIFVLVVIAIKLHRVWGELT